MRGDDARPLTYAEVGATREEPLPAGYGHVRRDVVIGHGRRAFEAAVDDLFGWQMHRRAGLGVAGSPARAAPGVTVELRAGWGPLSLGIPCRVVYTVEEPDRQGFAYGSLAGHPEQGEEAFLVNLSDVDDVRFVVRAFSRPATSLARAGGPVTRAVQQYATNRYVRAMRDLAGSTGRA